MHVFQHLPEPHRLFRSEDGKYLAQRRIQGCVQVRSQSVPRRIDGTLTVGENRRDRAPLSGVELDVFRETLQNVV